VAVPLRQRWKARPASRELGDRRRYQGALVALVLGTTAFAFQQTAVVPALPTIERELAAPERWAAWLLSGYLLIASVSGPLLGKLGDRFGKRRLIAISLACFLVGSIGAAAAPGIASLIVFRCVQGLGGAVFPLAQSVVRDEFPSAEIDVGMGWLTGAFGLGGALGLGLGGLIVEAMSWRVVFVLGALVVVAALALVRALVPRSPVLSGGRLDMPGAVLLALGIGALLIALTEAEEWGWGSARTLGLLAASAVVTALWVARELRTPEPLVDLRALADRPVFLANLATFLLGYVLFGMLFLVPHLVEARPGGGYGFGASAVASGLYLLPSALGQVVAGPLSGVVARRYGTTIPFTGGMLLAAGCAGVLAVWHDEPWQVAGGVLLLGLGLGFAIGPAAAIVAQGVRATETGVATALNSVTRRVGGAIGGQVAAALLAAITVGGGGRAAEGAFVAGFAACAAVALVGTVCALLVRRPGVVTARPEPA
jgi:EmrB/QacA subfamily drug resistance transporter